MFENRVLRRIYGPGRREAEEDHVMRNFVICTLHHGTRVIKARKMRWVGHVTCMGEVRYAYKILVRKP